MTSIHRISERRGSGLTVDRMRKAISTDKSKKYPILNLHPGEVIQVRREEEILETLDEKGTVQGLPFMPMMFSLCGRKFVVSKRADKIIVEGFGMTHMLDTVTLAKATCEGESQNCKRTCMILWKEIWLKRDAETETDNQTLQKESVYCHSETRRPQDSDIFVCQSRSLIEASSVLSKWDPRRYAWNMTSGVYKPSEFVQTIASPFLNRTNRFLRGTDNKLGQQIKRTPTSNLNLQPGEFARVKSKEEILRTLDFRRRNRGLEFTPEMEKFCGGTYRVFKKLDKMVNEQTGKMRLISNTVLLSQTTCDGKAHGGCPRECYCLWREIWLEKVVPLAQSAR